MNAKENRDSFIDFMSTLKRDQKKIALDILRKTDIMTEQWKRLFSMSDKMLSIEKGSYLYVFDAPLTRENYLKAKYTVYSYKTINKLIEKHKKYITDEMNIFNAAILLMCEGEEIEMYVNEIDELPSYIK